MGGTWGGSWGWEEGRERYGGDVRECYETDAETGRGDFGFGFGEDVAAGAAALGTFCAEDARDWSEGGEEAGWGVGLVFSLLGCYCSFPAFFEEL